MTTDLLDVNVWIAVADRGHPHHELAKGHWGKNSLLRFAFCRWSMMGFLRIATNPAAMGGLPFTVPEAWNMFRSFM